MPNTTPPPTVQVRVDQLHFDPENPRLHDHPLPPNPTEDQLQEAVSQQAATIRMRRSMEQGYFLCPPPLYLVVHSNRETRPDIETGYAAPSPLYLESPNRDSKQLHYTVVDGNRQLATWQLLAQDRNTTRNNWTESIAPTLHGLVFANHQHAHIARIQRQSVNKPMWSRLAHARDYRRLQQEGLTLDQISQIYFGNYPIIHPSALKPEKLLEALDVWDSANRHSGQLWDQPGQFRLLNEALRIPAVRNRLGLDYKEPDDHQPDPETATRLLTQICGVPAQDGQPGIPSQLQPHAARPEPPPLDALAQIYADPAMLEQFSSEPYPQAADLVAYHHKWYQIDDAHQELAWLEEQARQRLEKLHSGNKGTAPQVRRITYTITKGHTSPGFQVYVESQDWLRDQPALEALQRDLNGARGAPSRIAPAAVIPLILQRDLNGARGAPVYVQFE